LFGVVDLNDGAVNLYDPKKKSIAINALDKFGISNVKNGLSGLGSWSKMITGL